MQIVRLPSFLSSLVLNQPILKTAARSQYLLHIKKSVVSYSDLLFPLIIAHPEEVEKKNVEQGYETAELRATLKSLDRERDELQQQVDEKTEEIMNLEARKIQSVYISAL